MAKKPKPDAKPGTALRTIADVLREASEAARLRTETMPPAPAGPSQFGAAPAGWKLLASLRGHLERIHIVAFEMKPAAGVYLVPEPFAFVPQGGQHLFAIERPDGSVTELFVNLGVTGRTFSDVAAWRKTIEHALEPPPDCELLLPPKPKPPLKLRGRHKLADADGRTEQPKEPQP